MAMSSYKMMTGRRARPSGPRRLTRCRLVEGTHSSDAILGVHWSKGQCRPGHAHGAGRNITPVRSKLILFEVNASGLNDQH